MKTITIKAAAALRQAVHPVVALRQVAPPAAVLRAVAPVLLAALRVNAAMIISVIVFITVIYNPAGLYYVAIRVLEFADAKKVALRQDVGT